MRSFDLDIQKPTLKPFSIPNTTLKKRLPSPPQVVVADDRHQYRKCLRNHDASLGGHGIDDCYEFMPSTFADPAIPNSLTCATYGCHRNLHHCLPIDACLCHNDNDNDNDEESLEDDNGERCLHRHRHTSMSPPLYSSTLQMLLTLIAAPALVRALVMACSCPPKPWLPP